MFPTGCVSDRVPAALAPTNLNKSYVNLILRSRGSDFQFAARRPTAGDAASINQEPTPESGPNPLSQRFAAVPLGRAIRSKVALPQRTITVLTIMPSVVVRITRMSGKDK
ncbi:MAG: hypothetical protein A2V70_11740 [Planctomycetes bacterium RBG_13_63_9]|nr:MAG: hypothetical protein A2V70_11740 [Planctomycetes bacterium RBG_13_63_9]